MKKLSIILLLIIALFSYGEEKKDSIKEKLYNKKKLNAGGIALSSFFVPSLGHYQVGKWNKGLLFGFARVGLLTTGMILDNNFKDNGFNVSCNCENGEDKDSFIFTALGLVFYAGLGVMEGFNAMYDAKRFNNNLYKEIYYKDNKPDVTFNITPILSKKHTGASLSISF